MKWYTVNDLANRLHLRPLTAWRILRPYRAKCHLGRNGSHPRKVLWIPADVVRAIERSRRAAA